MASDVAIGRRIKGSEMLTWRPYSITIRARCLVAVARRVTGCGHVAMALQTTFSYAQP